jgi:hypothetical protein
MQFSAPTGPRVAVRAQVAILGVLNEQITLVQEQVETHFGQHPDAEIYTSQPGLGQILAARVPAEFEDDPTRCADTRPGRTTSAPPRSPASPARRRSSWPGTCTTTGSWTPWAGRRSPRSADRQVPVPTTTSNATGAWPPSRVATARQPPRRDPARLPQDRHPLRRGHRLVSPPPARSTGCCLTSFGMGCLQRQGLPHQRAGPHPTPAATCTHPTTRHPQHPHQQRQSTRIPRCGSTSMPEARYSTLCGNVAGRQERGPRCRPGGNRIVPAARSPADPVEAARRRPAVNGGQLRARLHTRTSRCSGRADR